MTPARAAALAALALVALPAGAAPGGAGEALYVRGVLPSGRPLRGARDGGVTVEGEAAACATCHRRSGLGAWEGQTVIPPIIGKYLFRPGASVTVDLDAPHVQGLVPRKEAYTDATLAVAIRRGVAPGGRRLDFLMPRYHLDDAAMAALIGYLRTLTAAPVPGVDRDTLHFATIVAPDAPPAAKAGMLDVLEGFFADKNAGYRGESPPLRSSRGVMYRVNRKWELHVWELTGPPGTWEAQLERKLRETPVFAVVSGIAGSTWAPVHRFCERAGLPCLFPNTDLPVAAERDFYPVYYSRGVLLEADLAARALRGARGDVRRVVQVVRAGDVGAEGARALAAALGPEGPPSEVRTAAGPEPRAALASALTGLGAGDALVLWLRPGDLAALPPLPAGVSRVFASGLLGGLERAPLPADWRLATHLTYPVDLPATRAVRMNFALAWFKVKGIPVVDERVQTDTWLACSILSETVGHMLDSFVRDYLVERLEAMLSHRLVTGYYPRLGLAPGQRFASKGGYLVRFAGGEGARVVPETGWTTP